MQTETKRKMHQQMNHPAPPEFLEALRDAARPIHGEPLRFIVRSRRPGLPPYVVDLDEYGFNGMCHCEHFRFRLEPALLLGAPAGPSTRCWHINVARQLFLEEQLRLMNRLVRGEKTGCPMRCCPNHHSCSLNEQ